MQKLNLKFKENLKLVSAIKPIISGFDEKSFQTSDNYRLLSAVGSENISLDQVKSISRYTLKHPFSPDIAAKMEGVEINFEEIISFCEEKIAEISDNDNGDSRIFIEMAGGACSPCSDFHTMADISFALSHHEPCNILVTTPYLGSISHTISALRVLKFDVLIVNRYDERIDAEFLRSLKNHLPYEVEVVVAGHQHLRT